MTPIILFVGTTRHTNRQNPNGSVSASVPALELPICPLVMHATPEQIAKHGIGMVRAQCRRFQKSVLYCAIISLSWERILYSLSTIFKTWEIKCFDVQHCNRPPANRRRCVRSKNAANGSTNFLCDRKSSRQTWRPLRRL